MSYIPPLSNERKYRNLNRRLRGQPRFSVFKRLRLMARRLAGLLLAIIVLLALGGLAWWVWSIL